MSCEVYLLSHTPSPDETVGAAARLCYSKASAKDLLSAGSGSEGEFIAHLRKSGHFSTFEHVSFTFAIDGISRVCSHQLVRHRLASYSQQSQRYVTMEDVDVVVPPSILKDEVSRQLYIKSAREAHAAYKRLVDSGVPKEDARYLLPHGWRTRLVLTMNARELHHFLALRLCRRAQWEIQELARKMLLVVRDAAPKLFEVAGPSCLVDGVCREIKSCGAPFRSMEELLRSDVD